MASIKSSSTTETVALGSLSLLSVGISLGFSLVYLNVPRSTRPKEYIKISLNNSQAIVASATTLLSLKIGLAAAQGMVRSVDGSSEKVLNHFLSPHSK
jgi:hypothetical protein